METLVFRAVRESSPRSGAQGLFGLLDCYTYMKAVVETLEDNKVKLSVELDEEEFEKDIDAAFRKIAREVRIPGFRPGKAPRRILEARLGKETGRAEAIRDALPDYYAKAVYENEIDVIAPPDLEVTSGEGSGPVAFQAVVEVRPRISLAGFENLRVEIPSPVVSDSDIEAQIDRMRARFGELEPAGRPAKKGDFVTLDVTAERDGSPVSSLSADDFLYEVGSAAVLVEFDEHLDGAAEGDELEFPAEVPGEGAVTVRLVVKEVKARRLPELTDEWASEASEFDTVEELRADLAQRMAMVKRAQSSVALRNAVLEALVELVTDEVPKAMVDSEVQRQIHDLGHRLEGQRATIDDYLQATGQTPEELVASYAEQAVPSVKADLALRSVAERLGLEPSEADMEGEFERLARVYGMEPGRVRADLESSGQLPAVRADWKKTHALEWLLQHAEIVDKDGNPIDRSLLESEPATKSTNDPDSGVSSGDDDTGAPADASLAETDGDATAGDAARVGMGQPAAAGDEDEENLQ